MYQSICGANCGQCEKRVACGGCAETKGSPFGQECPVAACCRGRGQENCGQCGDRCQLKAPLIAQFNALGIEDMEPVEDLVTLQGSYINLTYTLPSGQAAKLLEDDKIYLGGQVHKKDSPRCYGLAADESLLLVCEYDEYGAEPEIVVYRRRER